MTDLLSLCASGVVISFTLSAIDTKPRITSLMVYANSDRHDQHDICCAQGSYLHNYFSCSNYCGFFLT